MEVAHKNLQNELKREASRNNKDINIDKIILNVLDYYNYKSENSTTNFKPIDLKDIQDENIIKQVIQNINSLYLKKKE